MKCTLRKVAEGIVATVDIQPKKGQPYYNFIRNWANPNAPSDYKSSNFETIIASTFGIRKKLITKSKGAKFHLSMMGIIDLQKEYKYTETENQIIINV